MFAAGAALSKKILKNTTGYVIIIKTPKKEKNTI